MGRGLVSSSLWLLDSSATKSTQSTTADHKKEGEKESKGHGKDDHKQFVSRKYLKETELSSHSTDVLDQLKEADTVEEALHIMEDVSHTLSNVILCLNLLLLLYGL